MQGVSYAASDDAGGDVFTLTCPDCDSTEFQIVIDEDGPVGICCLCECEIEIAMADTRQ